MRGERRFRDSRRVCKWQIASGDAQERDHVVWCCSGVALFEQVDLTYAVPVPLAWVASCSCPVSSLKAPKLCGARLKDEAVAGARGIRWRPARWVEAR